MYGDYPICTYESIRTKVREYETVNLTLMVFDKKVVHPNNTHSPPIVYLPLEEAKAGFEYSQLLEKYFKLFPINSVIYKFLPDERLNEFYFKKTYDRKEKLLKYTESGECDFPLNVKISCLKNLFSLKKHLDQEKYHESDVDLPFFEILESIESIQTKEHFFQVLLYS